MIYTELERKFDAMTPSWIVSTSRLIETFGEKSRFSFVVPFKGKAVRKASVRGVDGVKTWRRFETEHAVPDFVVMSSDAYGAFSSAERRCREGQQYVNPFRRMGCKTGWYVELLGSYWHSGPFVQGLSREEHEREMREAYASAGARVLLLWEDDVYERWGEVCEPKLRAFLSEASASIDLPVGDVEEPDVEPELELAWKSLADAEYWKGLSADKRDDVIDVLCRMYGEAGFPHPDRYMALYDFRRFCEWADKDELRKSSRFGMNCCRHFCESMADAKCKGKPSLSEVWADEGAMKKSIRWQLENESGSHHARRFLNAMCHGFGFRVVANMRPSVAVMWVKKYGKVGGTWFDPCAGWGSRMLAAHALGMKYVAIDANSMLVSELNGMADVLGLNATVHHGDASEASFVSSVMGGDKADIVFTSPPFFDLEWYSDDSEQSISMYSNEREWHERFLGPLIENGLSVLDDDGVALFNIGTRQRLDWTSLDFSDFGVSDFDVEVAAGGRVRQERLLRIVEGCNESPFQCRLCGRLFAEPGSHLARAHGISIDDYREENPDVTIERKARKRPSGLNYRARKAYRLPDGSYVRRKDAWRRAWGSGEPPDDSVVNAEDAEFDEWADQAQGEDYVECNICGKRGQNLTRHLRGKHGIEPEDYDGPVKSEVCKENLSRAATKTWDARGRKPKKRKEDKQTWKENGLDEDALCRLKAEGLSDEKIGEMYGMTGAGVAYRRKKWGIPGVVRCASEVEGLTTIPHAAIEHGVSERTLAEWLSGSESRTVGKVKYYDEDVVDEVVSSRMPDPDRHADAEELMGLMGKDGARQVIGWLRRRGVEPALRHKNICYFDRGEALRAWREGWPVKGRSKSGS